MRHQIQPRLVKRDVTRQRLAAAERHLRKERERFALFADEVASEQPTALARIESIDNAFLEWQQDQRRAEARRWREARRRLQELPAPLRTVVLGMWNDGGQPATAGYLLSHIHDAPRRLSEMARRGEQWFVFEVQGRRVVLPWQLSGIIPPSKVAGPFSDYLEAAAVRDEHHVHRETA